MRIARIPDGALRTTSNRKAWTAEQAETIEQWYHDYRRIAAGCCVAEEEGKDGHGVALQ